jgi:hypothetical protein
LAAVQYPECYHHGSAHLIAVGPPLFTFDSAELSLTEWLWLATEETRVYSNNATESVPSE